MGMNVAPWFGTSCRKTNAFVGTGSTGTMTFLLSPQPTSATPKRVTIKTEKKSLRIEKCGEVRVSRPHREANNFAAGRSDEPARAVLRGARPFAPEERTVHFSTTNFYSAGKVSCDTKKRRITQKRDSDHGGDFKRLPRSRFRTRQLRCIVATAGVAASSRLLPLWHRLRGQVSVCPHRAPNVVTMQNSKLCTSPGRSRHRACCW